MSPALLICAAGACISAWVGVVVGACMVADLIVRWIDGRRHRP